jgi:3',5'-cyclic AMP phosphodiesterase CpdA
VDSFVSYAFILRTFISTFFAISSLDNFNCLLEKVKEDGDALVLTGDIFDYVSPAHVRFFEKTFKDLKIPYIFAPGNHEVVEEIPSESFMSKIKAPYRSLELDDITIVAIDDSKKEIRESVLEDLKREIRKDKKIIISMHTPFIFEGTREFDLCGEYFRLNHQGCPPENLEFLELLKENEGKIIAVLAGHIHCSSLSKITDNLMQYTASQGILGNVNRYVLGE